MDWLLYDGDLRHERVKQESDLSLSGYSQLATTDAGGIESMTLNKQRSIILTNVLQSQKERTVKNSTYLAK